MSIGHYIVLFKPHVSLEEVKQYADEVRRNGGEVTHSYDIIKGFAAHLTEQSLNALQNLQGVVDTIEPDSLVSTQK